jgi:uncharacterized membrane protein
MNTILLHLLVGPLLLVLSFLYKKFPPKKINQFYGYRTSRSMKSQEAWDCANLYSAHAFIVIAILTCMVQAIAYLVIQGDQSILWAAGFLTIGVIAIMPITEMHLKNKGF